MKHYSIGLWYRFFYLCIDGTFLAEIKLQRFADESDRILIIDTLESVVDQKAAAAHLGIPESTLKRKMDKYSIESNQSGKARQNLQYQELVSPKMAKQSNSVATRL